MSKHTNVETFKVIINISPPETAEIQQILQKSGKQQRYHLRFDFCNQTLNQVENQAEQVEQQYNVPFPPKHLECKLVYNPVHFPFDRNVAINY